MFDSLVFLDIAQNCSLGQCLTSSTAKTSKKKKKVVRAEIIFSILMSLSVHSNLLVYSKNLKFLRKRTSAKILYLLLKGQVYKNIFRYYNKDFKIT